MQLADYMKDVRAQMLEEGYPYFLPQADSPGTLGGLIAGASGEPQADVQLIGISYTDDGTVILTMPAAQL
eukprot:9473782-Pyramimonas_sp.AAC.1